MATRSIEFDQDPNLWLMADRIFDEIDTESNPTARYAYYQTDILGFFRNELKIKPTADEGADQVKILLSIQDAVNGKSKRYKAIRSGHNTGKTEIICAGTALWWACVFNDFKVITTAPTWRQVSQLIWPDIHKHLRNAPHIAEMFEVLKTQMVRKGYSEWYVVGVNSDDPFNIAGYHAEHVLVIADESAGISDEILDAVKAAMASKVAVMIAVGNPLSSSGFFREAFHNKRDMWDTFQLDSEKSRWVDKQWIEECRNDWGEESPIYKARVKGEFPDQTIHQLIPLSHIERAEMKEFDIFNPTIRVMGVDVASLGGDWTVATVVDVDEQNGLYDVIFVEALPRQELMPTVGTILKVQESFDCNKIVVDANGLGEGVYSRLKEQSYPVVDFKAGRKSSDPENFLNIKAEGYMTLKRIFEGDNNVPTGRIRIPSNVKKLGGELSMIEVEYMSNKKMKIIDPPKSPDYADSLMMAIMYRHAGTVSYTTGTLANLQAAYSANFKRNMMQYRRMH